MPGEAVVRLAIANVVRHRSLFAMHMAEAIVFPRLLPRPGALRPDNRIAELMGVAPTVYRFPGYPG
jgi:hypothetical protein